MQNELTNDVDQAPPCYFRDSRQRQICSIILMLNTSVNLNEFFNPYFSLCKISSNYFNYDYLKVQTIQTDFCLSKLYFILLIQTQIEQIQFIKKLLADLFDKGPFKKNVTAKMQNFRPLSSYPTVSHFFNYTPSPCVTRQKATFSFFPRF